MACAIERIEEEIRSLSAAEKVKLLRPIIAELDASVDVAHASSTWLLSCAVNSMGKGTGSAVLCASGFGLSSDTPS